MRSGDPALSEVVEEVERGMVMQAFDRLKDMYQGAKKLGWQSITIGITALKGFVDAWTQDRRDALRWRAMAWARTKCGGRNNQCFKLPSKNSDCPIRLNCPGNYVPASDFPCARDVDKLVQVYLKRKKK